MSILTILLAALFVCAIIYVAFFRRDQFGQYRDRPFCYGSDPSPQDMAENDCRTCPYALGCLAIFK